MKIRYGIIGSGWRSEIYARIAHGCPAEFEAAAVLVRSAEKIRRMNDEFGIPATTDKREFLSARPDFLVIAVGKQDKLSVLKEFLVEGIPMLLETPAGISVREMHFVWKAARRGAKLLVAEQYPFFPPYRRIIDLANDGRIGTVQSAALSCVHGYHAAGLARKILGIRGGRCRVFATSYRHGIVETDSRYGKIRDGRSAVKERTAAVLEFDGNRQLYYLFDPVQYHSDIRTNTVLVYGDRGEIRNDEIRYVNAANESVCERIGGAPCSVHTPSASAHPPTIGTPADTPAGGAHDDPAGPSNGPTDDEIAVAECLRGMKIYIETGTQFYDLADALEDAYLSILMDQAIQGGRKIRSRGQPWNR